MSGWVWRRVRWLRYLAVWPAITAYRRRARQSLRWRLAGYNLATLIAGLATALVLVGALAAVGASARRWAEEEPADDARAVAEFLVSAGLVTPGEEVRQESLHPVLNALASGAVPLYRGPGQDQFDVRPEQYLQGVSGIAFVTADHEISGPAGLEEAFGSAASGSTDLRENSHLAGDAGAGAYPMFAPDGGVFAVVVVQKDDIQAPQGWGIPRAQIRPVVTTVWVGSVVAAIPGLAVAVLLAIAAARSVGGRVREVANAAEALAEGSLASRVPVRGEDEVASLSRSFNVMAERLQQTMGSLEDERARAVGLLEANRQLVANVSHELRTPVALIRGQVEALDEDTPGNPRVEMALRETGRLEQLVTDLFQLASAEAGALQMDLRALDVAEVVRDATGPLIEPARRESQVTLVVEALGPVVAAVDHQRLTRVVQNILRNAIRHTPEGGLVRILVEREGADAVVLVSDSGPGIPEGDLDRVFQRFYRGDASRARDTGGAGLGLAIAQEMIEAMGGIISAESPPGEGATFRIVLPAPG